ncbi:MAG: hypothetical protein M1829_004435 [Trizodia sp. TS-e1964]|nr:MAG: hypothetical protein M1829_004435 [Trizodia sp. TS-e1964]
MDIKPSLVSLLGDVTASLILAAGLIPPESRITPPPHGISLLDIKNDLLLSYLQNLVFLVISKLRKGSASEAVGGPSGYFEAAVVNQLVELRVYLEKGIRSLEGRLKYQVDKVISAANDASALQPQLPKTNSLGSPSDGRHVADEGASDTDYSNKASQLKHKTTPAPEIDELNYRPNPRSFQTPGRMSNPLPTPASEDFLYRPPRIVPTSMMANTARRNDISRKPLKSTTLEEFVNTEFSSAPFPEPSIGTTIKDRGRHAETKKEREIDDERRNYEERNFVRLPSQTKKEKSGKRAVGRAGTYGGEEWIGLSAGVDRIERLTTNGKGHMQDILGRSRKRKISDSNQPIFEMGERFEKRKALVSKRRK